MKTERCNVIPPIAKLLTMGLVLSSAHAETYPAPTYVGPALSYQFPAGFSTFDPPIADITPVAGTPEIFEWTRDNNAGDTVIVTGENFSSHTNGICKNEVTVNSILFANFADTVKYPGFSWSGSTVVEITAKAFQAPANGDWLFHIAGGGQGAGIYYSNGKWYAQNGGSAIEMGTYDSTEHTYRYDCVNRIAAIDGQSVSLGGTVSMTSDLYLGCNSPGYQDFPLEISGYKIWQNGSLVVDAVPLVDGTFENLVDHSIVYNSEQSQGLPRPFVTSVTRDISISSGGDACFIAYGSGATSICNIVRLNVDEVAVQLPDSLPRDEMYLLWPGNLNGFGIPVALNKAEVWWLGPDQINPGQPFSVYGRNFGSECWIYIEELNQWIGSDSSNPYKADFTLPSGVATGSYTIWVHNGSGGIYGWSRSMPVSVVAPYMYNGRIVNVTDYGAVGDGSADDRSAIAAAMSASSPGDTLYFPEGTYTLSSSLPGISGRKIIGDGIDRTILRPHTSTTSGGMLFDGLFTDMVVSNLTCVTISSAESSLFRWSGQRNLFDTVKLSSINWGADGFGNEPFTFIGNQYLTFRNCDFINAGNPGNLNIGGTRQVFIDQCRFFGAKHSSQLVGAWGGEEISIQNCTAQPYDSTTTGDFDGRWFVTADYWGAVNRIYFGDNRSINIAPPKDGTYHANTGEQILIEGGKFRTRGTVVEATSNTVRLESISNIESVKNVITIVAGKGYGQSRKITSINTASNTLILSEPWRVIPDTGSTYVVAATTYRFVVYNNHFDGKGEWVDTTEHTASAGVESYGGSVDLVVDGNRFTDLRVGIVHWPLGGQAVDGVVSLQSCFFNTFINNTISHCWQGISSIASSDNGILDGGILAATFRDNRLDTITTHGASFSTSTNEPIIRMSVFERNTFNNCRQYAVLDTPHIQDQLFLDNTGTNSNQGTAMSISYDHIPALKGNAMVGYAVNFARGPTTQRAPEKLLNLPISIVKVSQSLVNGDPAVVPVWNLGISNMSWSASCPNGWVEIDGTNVAAGEVDGQSEEMFVLSIVPEMLPEKDANASISVVSGTQTQEVTVVYKESEVSDPPPPPDPPPTPVLSSIVVSGPASIDEKTSAQYVCTANYSDGSSATVTPTWSEDSTYATISSSGLLSALDVTEDQSMTITASYSGLTTTHAVTIKYIPVVLTGIGINGPTSLDEGTSAQYLCTAYYSDGTSVSIAPTWSEDSTYAIIDANGLLSAGDVLSDQSVTITASFEGQTDTLPVTIRYIPPILTGIAISGPSSIDEETTAQYTCIAFYSDGTSLNVAPVWSENSAYTTINSSGLLSAGNVTANQSVTITAGFGGQTDTHPVTIRYVAPVLTGITISGPTSIDEESSAQYVCTASYSDGTTDSVVPVWSENSIHASISSSGLLTAGDVTENQIAVITATFEGESDTHTVTINYVVPPVVITDLVISGPATLKENTSATYTCVAHYSDGSSASVTPVWAVDPSVSTIDTAGILRAGNVEADQVATITASFEDFFQTYEVMIEMVGPGIVYSLQGFDGKRLKARLWRDLTQSWTELGEMDSPNQLVIEDLVPDQWYWVSIKEYNQAEGIWENIHGAWISM